MGHRCAGQWLLLGKRMRVQSKAAIITAEAGIARVKSRGSLRGIRKKIQISERAAKKPQ
jgi:hypothetical protein